MAISRQLKQLVRQRAGNRCEYCHLPDGLYDTPFHVDHVISQQHGGKTVEANLALACFHCNLHKGPNVASVDQETNQIIPLFDPRSLIWSDHFSWRGPTILARTATGRATIVALALNDPDFVAARWAFINEGTFKFE